MKDRGPLPAGGPAPAAPAATVEFRDLRGAEDYLDCLELQEVTWGSGFSERVPPAILKIVQETGGVCIGAFEERDGLVGFVLGLTGIRSGEPVHWSHMLAVRSDHRNQGIGRALKRIQAARVRSLGIRYMLWTFDPLVARNAHLNLNVIGASVDAYVVDMYGSDPRNTMDDIIGTDRLVVRWDLRPPSDAPPGAPPRDHAAPYVNLDPVGNPSPHPRSSLGEAPVRVAVPEDIQILKGQDPELARSWRAATRAVLEPEISKGAVIAAFETTARPYPAYLISRTRA